MAGSVNQSVMIGLRFDAEGALVCFTLGEELPVAKTRPSL